MKAICGTCGDSLLKKDTFKCADCGMIICPVHTFTRIDPDNISITRNAPKLCINCYKKRFTHPALTEPYEKVEVSPEDMDAADKRVNDIIGES